MNTRQEHLLSIQDLEGALGDWLAIEAPAIAPQGVRETILATTAELPQRRGLLHLPALPPGARVAFFPGGVAATFVLLALVSILLWWRPQALPVGPLVPAGELSDPRSGHTATLLQDGRVLIVGGMRRSGSLAGDLELIRNAEVWDPRTRTFSPAGALNELRIGHTATMLDDGRVLIVGGQRPEPAQSGRDIRPVELASVEVWDPHTATFTLAGSLNEPRFGHTATRLDDGRVLIAGGAGGEYEYVSVGLASTELWDPASSEFSPGPEMTTARVRHSATALADGRVLMAGGEEMSGTYSVQEVGQATAELWTPEASAFIPTGSMAQLRGQHSATLLEDGRVLVLGGVSPRADGGEFPEVWDPASGTFEPAGEPTRPGYWMFDRKGVLLDDGRVAFVGVFADIEIWDPASFRFERSVVMREARDGHSVTKLPDGRVLIVGGSGSSFPGDRGNVLASALLFDPSAKADPTPTPRAASSLGSFAGGPTLPVTEIPMQAQAVADRAAVLYHSSADLDSGCVARPPARALVWQFDRQRWAEVALRTAPRVDHSTIALADGLLLVVGGRVIREEGGDCQPDATQRAELIDAFTGEAAAAGDLPIGLGSPTLVALRDGNVLVLGGSELLSGEEEAQADAWLWDRTSATLTSAGTMDEARGSFTATALADGRVLVVGGLVWDIDCSSPFECRQTSRMLDSAVLWDPASATFQPAGTMGQPRIGHSATLLADGRVLVMGGRPEEDAWGPDLRLAEVWDPATGSFAPAGLLPSPRPRHTATLLPDGRVLVAGGSTGPVLLWDPETGSFSEGPVMIEPRLYHAAALLPDGSVALAGGLAYEPAARLLSSVEIFTPAQP